MAQANLTRPVLGLVLCALAAGCTPQPAKQAAPAPAKSQPFEPRHAEPLPIPAGEVEEPRTDTCGANEHQHLIGKPRSQIPVPTHPARFRVACLTCPVTADFNAARVNILYDDKTGIVKDVRCG